MILEMIEEGVEDSDSAEGWLVGAEFDTEGGEDGLISLA